jgi:hypothetical protein
MIIRYITILFVLSGLSSNAQMTDSEPQITLTDLSDGITGFHYIWRVPRSTLVAQPKWIPEVSEVPLSPHKAALIASKYVASLLPQKTKLSIINMSLSPQGEYPPLPTHDAWWGYQISFSADPEPSAKDKPLLQVLILLDGTIVKAEVSPLK